MSSKHQGRRSSIVKEIFGMAAHRLIEFGVPNEDGLIVQRHDADASKEAICLLSEPSNEYKIKHEEIAGTARTIFMPDGLYVSVIPWPGSRGDLLRKAMQVGVEFIPCGTGGVDENGYVWDYKLLYFYLNLKKHEHTDRNPI